jgi:hypothetical protein
VRRFLSNVPEDWDQIYFGGQHLNQRTQSPKLVGNDVVRGFDVNRTHAYAIRGKAFIKIYQWLTNYVEHSKNPRHHVDHRFGALHQTGQINVYAPTQWLAGQTAGFSNIKHQSLVQRWWSGDVTGKKLPKFVAVLGLHRSGSSCLAGVLHKLGVHMGDRLVGHEKSGGFEAAGLAYLCERAFPFPTTELKIPEDELKSRLEQHVRHVRNSAFERGKPFAGGKYPHLCVMGPLLREICGMELRVIHINRPLQASIKSLQARSATCTGWLHTTPSAAAKAQRWLWTRKTQFLKETNHLTVEYSDLISRPEREIQRITDYLCFKPTSQEVRNAISHVRPELCHYKVRD